MRRWLPILLILLATTSSQAQRPSDDRAQLRSYTAHYYDQFEQQWVTESAFRSLLRPRFLNEYHKRAVKAFEQGDWANAVVQYEACVRAFGLSLRQSQSDADTMDLRRAQMTILKSPALSGVRFDLALAYANRADELLDMGRSQEADSLLKLSTFFVEYVKIPWFGPSSTLSFIRLADLNSRLGRSAAAAQGYRAALWAAESGLPPSDPLRAAAGLRLGGAYMGSGDYEGAESALLKGTECADSAAAANQEWRGWCFGMSVEGRLMLAEDYRQLERQQEAESLYAEAMGMALGPQVPVISPGSLSVFENWSRMLRARGDQAEADSVNYHTDYLRRRWEHDQAAKTAKKKP
jgi:hypothetical protein